MQPVEVNLNAIPASLARRALLLALTPLSALSAMSALSASARAADPAARDAVLPLSVFYSLFDDDRRRALAALGRIGAEWQDGYAALLIELLGFLTERQTQAGVVALLDRAAGRPLGDDLDRRYAWLWSINPRPHPDYAEFKAALYEQIDPRFREYFANDRQTLIRLDEIRWGGVRRDGIPPLKNPPMVGADQAGWLADGHVVFGIEIDGDARAYPKRILAWHEMFKDRVGGREVTGVYCTLCGAMVLYDSVVAGTHHELGTSGFLYRSNKLMYDQATKSMWSTLGGNPVVGPLVGQGIELLPLQVVTTTWGAWRARHPQSRVLSLATGHQRDYAEGVAYRDYFANDKLMFGVPRLDARLPNKAEVLALRSAQPPAGALAETLAIAADYLRAHPVHHDRLGPQELVVLTDASGANRVYAAGGVRLASWDGVDSATDREGVRWRVDEGGLHGPAGQQLARLPAHRAFWFGWYAAYPQTRLVK